MQSRALSNPPEFEASWTCPLSSGGAGSRAAPETCCPGLGSLGQQCRAAPQPPYFSCLLSFLAIFHTTLHCARAQRIAMFMRSGRTSTAALVLRVRLCCACCAGRAAGRNPDGQGSAAARRGAVCGGDVHLGLLLADPAGGCEACVACSRREGRGEAPGVCRAGA